MINIVALWLGTAGLFVSDGETSFFIDPYVSRVSVYSVFSGSRISPDIKRGEDCIAFLKAQKAVAVLVGHSHFDHLLDASEFAKNTGAVIIGSESTTNAARGACVPEDKIRVIKNGDTVNIGAFSVRFIEGVHGPAFLGRIPYQGTIDKPLVPPAKASGYKLGGFYGMVVSHPLGTFIHHGSAGWIDGMYDGIKADAVFLCIAGRNDTKGLIEQTIVKTSAKTVIPIHYDWFFSTLDKPLKLVPGVKMDEFIGSMLLSAPDVEVRFVGPMQEFEVFR
jgi:L-ascorbate metabolism protein UlaG (beta-lactamase superfamily)